jgi:uncharacterized membrane protein required for colicin V production
MIIDVLIVIIGITALFRGRDIGFVRQLFSTLGFFGGLFLGALLEPHTVQLVHSASSRGLVTIVTTLGCALLLLTVGEYIGLRLKHKVLVFEHLNHYDNGLGAVLSVVSLLFSIWLTAAVVTALPYPGVESAIRSSAIITLLDRALPGAPNVILSQFRGAMSICHRSVT